MCRRPEELCSVDRLYYCPSPLAHLCVVCCILFAKIMNNVLINFDGTRVHDDDSGVGTPIGVRRVSAVSFALAFW